MGALIDICCGRYYRRPLGNFSKESSEAGLLITMKKYIFFLIPLSLLFLAGSASAVCPVCTVAVSAGVGLCRWLGVDDLISGAWIGGLCVSLVIWVIGWFRKKQIKFSFQGLAVSIAVYLIIVLPLWFLGILGHPLNKFWGVDKLIFGIISGSVVFAISVWIHNFLKKKNGDKSYFPYQKVVIPFLSLLILSLVFYFYACPVK